LAHVIIDTKESRSRSERKQTDRGEKEKRETQEREREKKINKDRAEKEREQRKGYVIIEMVFSSHFSLSSLALIKLDGKGTEGGRMGVETGGLIIRCRISKVSKRLETDMVFTKVRLGEYSILN